MRYQPHHIRLVLFPTPAVLGHRHCCLGGLGCCVPVLRRLIRELMRRTKQMMKMVRQCEVGLALYQEKVLLRRQRWPARRWSENFWCGERLHPSGTMITGSMHMYTVSLLDLIIS